MFKRLVILKVEFVITYVIIIKIYLIAYVYMKFHLCWHNLWHNWFSCSLSEEKKFNKVIHVALHSCKKGHCLTCSKFWLAAPGDQCPGEHLSAHLPLPHTPHPPESVQATFQPCPGVHSQSQWTFRSVM